MSTKAIEKVLHDTGVASRDSHTDEAVAAALEELAAIRKAAAVLERGGREGWPTTEMGELNMTHAFALFAAIAREEP